MSYFSRLTDIVTCSLTEILAQEANPQEALQKIITEMEEGLAGAQRSVKTAETNVRHFQQELDEHRERLEYWESQARTFLETGDEDQARLALSRKYEVNDLIAGLQQQEEAALATQNHLHTTLRAIEARLQDAKRRLLELQADRESTSDATSELTPAVNESVTNERAKEIEAELASLRQQIKGD